MVYKTMNSKEFKELMAKDNGKHLAIFTAQWCGFSKKLKGELETVPVEFEVVDVDVTDEEDCCWDDYALKVVPTAIVFSGGKEVARKKAGFFGLKIQDLSELDGKV